MRFSNLPALLLTILCAFNCAAARTPLLAQTVRAVEQPREDAELEALIIMAKAARAEVAADVLLRVAALERVGDPRKRRELIEDAFLRAGEAQQPVKRKMWSGVMDSRSAYLAKAHDLDLDRLSLQARAVRAMLAVDKRKARELFSRIPELQLPALDCEDALAYDVTGFYETLKRVAQESFGPKEKAQSEHINLVLTHVAGIRSPAQVSPALAAVSSVDAAPDQLAVLIQALSAALKKVSGDPRSFLFSLRYEGVAGGVQQLAAAAKQKGVPAGELLGAFRAYLARNLGGGQCAETQTRRGREWVDGYVAKVNEWIGTPIAAEDVRPTKIEGAAKVYEYWTSQKSRELMGKYKALRFGGGAELLESERKSDSWARALQTFLDDLDDWDEGDEETEADYFNQRCALYEALVEIAPAGPMRTKVLQDFIRYLRDTNAQSDIRIEWMHHASLLLGSARSTQAAGQAELLEMLRDSGDAALQLYAGLQELQQARKAARRDD